MSSLYTIQAYPSHTIHINTHPYTSLLTQKKYKTFDVFHDFLGLRCGLCGPSTGALQGRPVGPPRRQRHPHSGPPRSPRGGPAPAAGGARRRGRDGIPHCAAHRGGRRPRGDLPGAAGGGGRGGRQGRVRQPLGPEEMDARCFGRFQGAKQNRIQHVK